MFALFINGAILIVAAAVFHTSGNTEIAEIDEAYQTSFAAFGCYRSEHSVRRRAARFRAKFDADRNARRTNRDGRFFEYSPAPVAAAFNHTLDRHRSGGYRHFHLRRKGTAQLLILSQVILSMQLAFRRFSARNVH